MNVGFVKGQVEMSLNEEITRAENRSLWDRYEKALAKGSKLLRLFRVGTRKYELHYNCPRLGLCKTTIHGNFR
jgi:hypothetical protein